MMVAAAFAIGIIVGLLFGPAKERLDGAKIDGFCDGYAAALSHAPEGQPGDGT